MTPVTATLTIPRALQRALPRAPRPPASAGVGAASRPVRRRARLQPTAAIKAARVTRLQAAPRADVSGVIAFVGVGANLGDAGRTVVEALAALGQLPACTLRRASAVYRSAPVDAAGPDFYNAVAELTTTLSPPELLQALQAIEQAFGRERPYHHAPRTLDLDLLLHGDVRLDTPALTLPHPRLQLRAFVLRPLLDLAPDLAAPGLGPLAAWLRGVADQTLEKLPAR